MVLVRVKREVDLVHEEPAVEIVDRAVWVVRVGVVFEALVHVVKRPRADYGNEVPFYTIAEEEMLIVDVDDVLAVYTKIRRVLLHPRQMLTTITRSCDYVPS